MPQISSTHVLCVQSSWGFIGQCWVIISAYVWFVTYFLSLIPIPTLWMIA